LIVAKREELHEDIVSSYEQTQKERDRLLQNITKESPQDKLFRLASEFEILNQNDLAEKSLRNVIALNDQDHTSFAKYAYFLLR
jgi:hypothetical protein